MGARARQARETTTDLIKTRVQVNKGFACLGPANSLCQIWTCVRSPDCSDVVKIKGPSIDDRAAGHAAPRLRCAEEFLHDHWISALQPADRRDAYSGSRSSGDCTRTPESAVRPPRASVSWQTPEPRRRRRRQLPPRRHTSACAFDGVPFSANRIATRANRRTSWRCCWESRGSDRRSPRTRARARDGTPPSRPR
jgi:hypothetical protein